jgi:hypothetical protein
MCVGGPRGPLLYSDCHAAQYFACPRWWPGGRLINRVRPFVGPTGEEELSRSTTQRPGRSREGSSPSQRSQRGPLIVPECAGWPAWPYGCGRLWVRQTSVRVGARDGRRWH